MSNIIKVKKINDFKPIIPKKSAFNIETSEHLPKMNQLIVVNARKGGGKSVFITTLIHKLLLEGVIDVVKIISPTYHSNKEIFEPLNINEDTDVIEPSKDAIKELIKMGQDDQDEYKEFLKKKVLYEKYKKMMKSDTPLHMIDPDMMMNFLEFGFFEEEPKWKYKFERPPRHFWLIDDCLGTSLMGQKSGLLNACIKHRHFYGGVGVSIAILTQSYACQQGLPRAIRENVSLLALGKCKDEKQLEKIHSEIGADINLENFDKLFKYATDKPHGFLVIDFSPKDPAKQFRSNWDEYIVIENIRN